LAFSLDLVETIALAGKMTAIQESGKPIHSDFAQMLDKSQTCGRIKTPP
jgi:hypothetical protein